jgi:hypothetical protein
MKPGLLVAAALWLSASLAFSQAVDKNKPHGRACISLLNSANGDEEALRADSEAGPGRKLLAHLDATAKCEALVAVFTKNGQPVAGWAPQFVELSARKEVLLPKAPIVWNWEKDTGALEAYVLFFAPGSKDGADLRALVGAMQKMNDSDVTKLQTNKLRELIGRAKIDKAAAERAAPPDAEVAGTFRMVVGFEWRDSARAVNFSAGKPGALIFPAVR